MYDFGKKKNKKLLAGIIIVVVAAMLLTTVLATGDEATINAAVAPYAASAAAILNPAPVEQPSQEEQAITGTVDESQITGGE